MLGQFKLSGSSSPCICIASICRVFNNARSTCVPPLSLCQKSKCIMISAETVSSVQKRSRG